MTILWRILNNSTVKRIAIIWIIIATVISACSIFAYAGETTLQSSIQKLLALKKSLVKQKNIAVLKSFAAPTVIIWVGTDTGYFPTTYTRSELRGWYPKAAGGQQPEMEVELAFQNIRHGRVKNLSKSIHLGVCEHFCVEWCDKAELSKCRKWEGTWYQYPGDYIKDLLQKIGFSFETEKQSLPTADVTLIYIGKGAISIFGFQKKSKMWNLLSIAVVSPST